jgi:hypothetical protein
MIILTSKTDTARRRFKELYETDYTMSKKDYAVGKILTKVEYDEHKGVITIGPSKQIAVRVASRQLWNNDVLVAKMVTEINKQFILAGLLPDKDFTLEVR